MNFKTTYFLFALLGLLVVVLAVTLFLGPTGPGGADHVFPSMHAKATRLDTDKITKVTIKPAGEAEIVLEKVDEKNWRITAPRAMPADGSAVSSLLFNLREARVDPDSKPTNRKAAGLDTPSRVITMEGDERTFELKLGEVTPGEANAVVYAESSDRKGQLLAIKKPDVRTALEDLAHFRGKDLLGDTMDATGLKLSMGKKQPVELKKDKGSWAYVQPPYGEADVGTLLTNLGNLTISHTDATTTDFVADAVPVGELGKYHLDAAREDVLRIEVRTKDGTTAALIGVGKKEGDRYFATVDDPKGKTRDVVKVSANSVEPFLKLLNEPGSLRNKNLVKLEGTPDAIDVKNRYGLLEFRKPEMARDWELYRDGKATKVDQNEVRFLIDAINRKDQATFPEVDAKRRKELGLDGDNVIVVRVWSESLERPDEKMPGKPAFKKDAKPVAELRIGGREGDNVAVERIWGDDKTVVLVPKTLYDAVDKGPRDYIDKSMPAFNPGSAEENVTRVELTRDGTTYVVTREKAAGPWKIEQPANLKGRNANEQVVRDVLADLNRLRAVEIVAEKADEKELAGWGLEKPPVKVVITVTKDRKDTKHEFAFGKERGAAKGHYAKLSDSPAVYVVEPNVVAGLKKELRDPTVVDFDLDKVQGVTFKGWQKVVGTVTTLTIDRKDRAWVVKDKAGFMLDPDRLERFLSSISKLQAERFATAGKGMDFKDGAFQVEVTLPDKKVITLTVGEEEGGLVYAQSSELKGETVMIKADLFKEVREKPAFFSK